MNEFFFLIDISYRIFHVFRCVRRSKVLWFQFHDWSFRGIYRSEFFLSITYLYTHANIILMFISVLLKLDDYGRDRIVVEFTTTYAIGAYHH